MNRFWFLFRWFVLGLLVNSLIFQWEKINQFYTKLNPYQNVELTGDKNALSVLKLLVILVGKGTS